MNREDIIRMAREAGIDAEQDTLCRYEGWVEPLKRFADLVAKRAVSNIDPASWMSWQEGYAAGAAAEREACAKVCETESANESSFWEKGGWAHACGNCAALIRARGQA